MNEDLHLEHPCRYDRYWFGGQTADGALWFAAAFGTYPNAGTEGVRDGAFMVALPEWQAGFIGSRPLAGDAALTVPGLHLEVLDPQGHFRLRAGAAAGGLAGAAAVGLASNAAGTLAAELEFIGSAAAVAEPRYTFALGGHTVMDLLRFTQGGRWSGWVRANGREWSVSAGPGTRDRSWGQRPIGKRPPAPAGTPPFPWFWLWVPLEFPGHTLLFHTNDHPDGTPWNRHAVLVPHGGAAVPLASPQLLVRYHAGTRRVAQVTLTALLPEGLVVATATTRFAACTRLAGYNHPTHGHGTDHGMALLHGETLDMAAFNAGAGADVHVQSPCTATLQLPGAALLQGLGMVEQMLLGPHAPSGFTGFADMAAGDE